MKKQYVFLLVLVSILFSSCYTVKTIPGLRDEWLNSNIGKTESQIIREYGPPTQVQSDGNNGKILVYQTKNTGIVHVPMNNPITNQNYGNIYKNFDHSTYLMFYVNANNKVYHYRHNIPEPTEKVEDPASTFAAVLGIVIGVGVFILALTTI